jgi:hypothetical protein
MIVALACGVCWSDLLCSFMTPSDTGPFTDTPTGFGYMAGEYPMSYLLQRFPLSKMTAINIIIWSAFLACMAVANGYQGLLAVRL